MERDANHTKTSADPRPYLTSVDTIEALTGLDLLTDLGRPGRGRPREAGLHGALVGKFSPPLAMQVLQVHGSAVEQAYKKYRASIMAEVERSIARGEMPTGFSPDDMRQTFDSLISQVLSVARKTNQAPPSVARGLLDVVRARP